MQKVKESVVKIIKKNSNQHYVRFKNYVSEKK